MLAISIIIFTFVFAVIGYKVIDRLEKTIELLEEYERKSKGDIT